MKKRDYEIIYVVPVILMGWYAAVDMSVYVCLLSIFMIYAVVKMAPFYRHRENLWVFLLSTVTLVPFNIRAAYMLNLFFLDRNIFMYSFGTLFWAFLQYSIEEIVLAYITRRLWRKQYRIFGYIDNETMDR